MLTQTGLESNMGWQKWAWNWNGGGGTPYDGLYGKAPPERGIFFRLQVYERVGISLDEVYERASALIAALAASLAVLKEKRTKFKNLREK